MARNASTAAALVLHEGRDVEIVVAARLPPDAGERPAGALACRPSPASAEAGRDDGDPDLTREPVVDGGAEDDVRVLHRGGADHLGCLVHLDEREVVAARNREQD